MAAKITLQSCSLQMRRIVGQDASGRNKLQSLTFEGIDDEATAATLLGVSNAVQSVITTPIANVFRNDKNLVEPNE